MLSTGPRGVRRAASASLVLMLALAGCGGSAEDPGDSTTTSPSGTPTDGQPIVLDFVIDSLQVSPTVNRVPVDIGDEVSLSVTSDADDTIHIHGVERQLVLTAGEKGVLDFEIPPGVPRGVYLVEAHDGGLILFELKVR